jgi:hypothetical protein
MCPCCGWCTEDSLPLPMQTHCNAECLYCDPPYYIGNESPVVQTAIQCQETLGLEAILRGFHHMQWVETISKLWVQPQAQRDGKTPNCKYPPEPAISLVTQAWDLFEALWCKQNEILHSSTSALLNKIDRNCTNRFLEFKRNQNDWICSTYCFMLDVPQRDFLSWLRERRRSLLHMWEHLKMFIQVKMMLNCDTFFEVRVPTDRDDSDDSYSLSDNVRLNWLHVIG